MRIMVTGSSGSIGQQLARKLASLGHNVTGLDLQQPKASHDWVTWSNDFTNRKSTRIFFGRVDVDVCYHLGAVTDVNWARQHPYQTFQINVQGTANIAEQCVNHNILLNYVSSCAVYGKTPDHPSHEDSLKVPAEIYGCTKLAAERIIEGFASTSSLRYNIARPTTGIGEGMRPVLAPYIFLHKAWKAEKISIHGTGKQTRPFIYIGDIVDGLTCLVDRSSNEAWNFTGNKDVSVLELAYKCLARFNRKPSDYLEFTADRPGQVMNEVIDSSKAKRVLGWTPKVNVDEALARTAKWMMKNE